MANAYRVLADRGFIEQTTGDRELERLFDDHRVTGYVGFDPSAPSLHAGSLVPIMALKHLELTGHRPLVVVGGGTGRVGDPSGKTEMRRILDPSEVAENLQAIASQLSRFLDLGAAGDPDVEEGRRGFLIDNADWLLPLRYIDFLRDIGCHFSVNRMLAAESVKLRLASESGLSFLEFNYSLLQAYDFLVLNQRYGCELQLGGSDQWGNIVAGIDLIRRVEGRQAHGITFPLLTTAAGHKMGKTERGAVWLEAGRTSPYDYYQFWVNTDDRDVGRFLRLYTLLPLEEVERLERLEGREINRAKEVLAFEATALCHGLDEAEKARDAARALFYGERSGDDRSIPTYPVEAEALEQGIPVTKLFHDCGLCSSRGEARRKLREGGLYVNESRVTEEREITARDLERGSVMLRFGQKRYYRVVLKE